MTFVPQSIIVRLGLAALLGAAAAAGFYYGKRYLPQGHQSAGVRFLRTIAPPRQVSAPEGVFFLSERVVLTRSSGIIAIAPGTTVRVLSRDGDTCHVTDGKLNFDVPAAKLTNDVNRAAGLSGNDLVTQETLARQMAEPNDEFQTTSGKIYKNATIQRVEPDGIILVTNSGVSKVYFTELPQNVQQRFHYDPHAAAEYASAQAANQAAFQKQQEDAQRKLAAERNKYWASLTSAAKHSGNAPVGAVSSAKTGSAIKVIAHGERVDINRHLALGRVTIVDFYADWCGPCRQVSPYLEQIANTDPEVALRKIDIVNWTSAVASQYSVHSIPQINIYNRRGTLVGTVVGSDLQQIQRYVAQAKTSG